MTEVTEDLVRYAEAMVREAGYNYAVLFTAKDVPTSESMPRLCYGEVISRASCLYDLAKEMLHRVDPTNADSFIKSTYGYEVTNG